MNCFQIVSLTLEPQQDSLIQLIVPVVNCFQIVSLTLEPQLKFSASLLLVSCELLSDCIFDIGTTTNPLRSNVPMLL